MDAVREEMNFTTGMLDLFNAQGGKTAELHFNGSGILYAEKTSGLPTDHVVISTVWHSNSLPVTYLH